MSATTPVALLELQVWAARALVAAGFPGGAVDQAARLVVLAQTAHDDAAACFVADLPGIAARDHGVPELGGGGAIEGRGLHALAVAPGVLDLVCADAAPVVWSVSASPGAWVLAGLALQGAARGRAVLAVSPERAVMAWKEGDGAAYAEASGAVRAALLAAAGFEATVPADGYAVTTADDIARDRVCAAASRVVSAVDHAAHLACLRAEGFAMPRAIWDGITGWGWKMLVPTSDRSKNQAGGDMGEG